LFQRRRYGGRGPLFFDRICKSRPVLGGEGAVPKNFRNATSPTTIKLSNFAQFLQAKKAILISKNLSIFGAPSFCDCAFLLLLVWRRHCFSFQICAVRGFLREKLFRQEDKVPNLFVL